MKNINIPEPCAEDWNKMTPNDKGAFCQKCALDVYDFTNKSPDEIREVLTLNVSNPVCMRIEPKQLDQLNNDFAAWKVQNKRSFDRAWIFTLLVVFGMTLFSCEEDEEPVVKEYQKIGQSILNQQEEEKVIDPILPNDVENHVNTNNSEINGVREEIEVHSEKVAVLGKPMYKEEPQEEKSSALNEVIVVADLPFPESYALGGVPMMSPEYNDYLIQTNTVGVIDSIEIKAEPQITGLVYPNPASNQTTLQVNMPKPGKAEIELFALNGQKIRSIHSGRIRKGESEYPIDLTDLETGMYLVVVHSGEMKETIKISKI